MRSCAETSFVPDGLTDDEIEEKFGDLFFEFHTACLADPLVLVETVEKAVRPKRRTPVRREGVGAVRTMTQDEFREHVREELEKGSTQKEIAEASGVDKGRVYRAAKRLRSDTPA